MRETVSVRAAKYLARYLRGGESSLKRFLYRIEEPGRRKKKVQRIIYGIMERWNSLRRILTEAGLWEGRKRAYYLVAAFRIVVDGWGPRQVANHMMGRVREEEAEAIASAARRVLSDAGSLSLKYGYPEWFVGKLSPFMGREELERVLSGLNKRVPTWFVVNSLKGEENAIVGSLESEGFEVVPDEEVPLLYRVAKFPKKLQDTSAYRRGLILPMQKASAAVVSFLKPEGVIYDSCAAPGIKSIFSVILSGGSAKVIALDKSETRLEVMRRLVRRYGVEPNVRTFRGDARFFDPKREFDKALVDAPCTSTGTIPKNPDIKMRLREEDVRAFSELQYEILRRVFSIAREGAEVVYSTCSVFPEENELVVSRLLEDAKSAKLVLPELGSESLIPGLGRRFWPHIHSTVGMFYTKIVKL